MSRIGQTHDVHVFNLVAAGTVEAAVLHLLEAKLSMFELVIGEIDMILGNLDEEREFQDVVADLWAESQGPDDFSRSHGRAGQPACWRPRKPTSSSGCTTSGCSEAGSHRSDKRGGVQLSVVSCQLSVFGDRVVRQPVLVGPIIPELEHGK